MVMRPHTRTQCTDGKDCLECGSSGEAVSGKAATNSHHQHEGGARASGGGGSPDAKGSGFDAAASNFSFVAPGRPRRSAKSTMTSAVANQTKPAAHSKAAISGRSILLVELPAELLVKILNCMSFKEISQVRLVSRRFNEICASMLNSTFQRLQACMLSRFQSIKGQMPRRESARRNHPLARECDIVETLHMRLTLLQMTFGKHIERKHICFFAGEILDEVKRILRYVRQTPSLINMKAYKITDELFDLSTMAMEYFKEHIEPTLPEITYFGTEFLDFAAPFTAPLKRRSQSGGANLLGCGGFDSVSGCSSRASVAGSSSSSDHWSVSSNAGNSDDLGFGGGGMPAGGENDPLPPQSNMVLRKRIRRIRQGMKRYNNQLVEVKRDLKSCKSKMESQAKQVQEYSSRLEEYDKKFEESSRKFQTLLTELNKCKTELQYWRSKSTSLLSLPPTCYRCDAPLIPQILPPMKSGGGAAVKDDALDELKALSNQGVFLPGEADAAAAEVSAESSKDGRQVQMQQPSRTPTPPAAPSATGGGGGGDILVPADPKAVAKTKGAPLSPACAGRKRRSRDDLVESGGGGGVGGGDPEPGTRKSLRGVGVKRARGKRSKVLSTGNQ